MKQGVLKLTAWSPKFIKAHWGTAEHNYRYVFYTSFFGTMLKVIHVVQHKPMKCTIFKLML